MNMDLFISGRRVSYTLDSMREQPTPKPGLGNTHGVQSVRKQ